jgi:selenocysteine lyase/cysteine desulfurase
MDFPTNHYVWLAQQKRGAKLDIVPSPDKIRVEAEDMVARIDEQTAVVNANRVLFESSWIMDMPPIVEAAHREGALVLVDDFHGSGIVPIDVHELGVDLLVSGCLKWLCGGQGLAFLYCRRGLVTQMEPTNVGWFGTEDFFSFGRTELNLWKNARRFETGTFALPQAWTAAAGLEIILEVGVQAIRERNQELTRRLMAGLQELPVEILSPAEDERRGGLVRARVPGGPEGAQALLLELLEKDVVVDKRGDALRISPHFFSNEDDIDRCLTVLSSTL